MHRLTLLCHGPVASEVRMAFPVDEPLDDRALPALERMSGTLPRADRFLTSPLQRARQTAEALGLDARDDPALCDLDLGRWRGRTLVEIESAEPEGVTQWLADPEAAPHGGEARSHLQARVGRWLAEMASSAGSTFAVTHPSVIRMVVLLVLEAPPAAFWRLDIEPLSLSELRVHRQRWTIRALNLIR